MPATMIESPLKILVTGARGFVGFSVAEVAARQGWQVWGIGRMAQPPVGWMGGYSWADIAQSDLTPIIQEFAPDVIFHGAGSASVGQSFDSPLDDFRASALTFASLLDSVRRSSCRPIVIFPSSAAVYGNPRSLPVSEEFAPAPISPYGYHKLQCELLAREYAQCFQIDIIIGRLFSVFGARQSRLIIWEIFEQFTGGKPDIQLLGTGDETRDYLHVNDCAHIMLQLALEKRKRRGTGVETYNVASGKETSVMELAEMIGTHLKREKPILRNPTARRGDPLRWCADASKIEGLLDLTSQRPLKASLGDTLDHWALHTYKDA